MFGINHAGMKFEASALLKVTLAAVSIPHLSLLNWWSQVHWGQCWITRL